MFSRQRQIGLTTWTRLPALLLGMMTLFSACSAPPSSGPPPGPGAAKSAAMPAVSKPVGPPRPMPAIAPPAPAKPTERNSLIAMASEILTAGTNPFLTKLPKPKVEVVSETAEGAPVEAPPMVDAFENFQLLGVVVKSGSKAMALLSLGSDTGTEMVRVGDMFFANGNQISVKSITRDEVTLEKIGPAPEVKVLPLPSIVGYGGTGSSAGEGSGAAGMTDKHPVATGGTLKLEEL